MAAEKFCLQWNDFQKNPSVAFQDLRDDVHFTDVTQAFDYGPQIDASLVPHSSYWKSDGDPV